MDKISKKLVALLRNWACFFGFFNHWDWRQLINWSIDPRKRRRAREMLICFCLGFNIMSFVLFLFCYNNYVVFFEQYLCYMVLFEYKMCLNVYPIFFKIWRISKLWYGFVIVWADEWDIWGQGTVFDRFQKLLFLSQFLKRHHFFLCYIFCQQNFFFNIL